MRMMCNYTEITRYTYMKIKIVTFLILRVVFIRASCVKHTAVSNATAVTG